MDVSCGRLFCHCKRETAASRDFPLIETNTGGEHRVAVLCELAEYVLTYTLVAFNRSGKLIHESFAELRRRFNNTRESSLEKC